MRDYTVTVRNGPRVRKERFDDLRGALDALERKGRELEGQANRGTVDLKVGRRFEPVQQVAARIELSGPARLRAGVDVRGDGSAEGYTGRIRRRLVEQRRGESPYDALRRALAA
jgi:hypothetical protein